MASVSESPALCLLLGKNEVVGELATCMSHDPSIYKTPKAERQPGVQFTQASRPLITLELVYSPWYQQWRTK